MTSVKVSRITMRIYIPIAIVLLLVLLGALGQLATIVPIKDAQTVAAISNGGVAFDKVKYVDSIWKSRVIPAAENDAVSIATLVPDLEKSPQAAEVKYGHDVGGAYSFLVSFSGTVTKVDTSSPTGTITVAAPVSGQELAIKVQIGPVILGTALRDAMKFISFGQFLNQVQYGGVGDELNSRVEQDVVSKLDLKSLQGKMVSVRGAFTYDGTNAKNLLVIPIIVTVGQGTR